MTRKLAFFEGRSWFKFNNLGLALGTNLKFYTSVAKGLKLKVKKFWGPNPTFVEVAGEKLVGGPLCPPPILNRVKNIYFIKIYLFKNQSSSWYFTSLGYPYNVKIKILNQSKNLLHTIKKNKKIIKICIAMLHQFWKALIHHYLVVH